MGAESFDTFLKTLEHKTWHQILKLIEDEFRRVQKSQPHDEEYLDRLICLASFLRYPTRQFPPSYNRLLLTMINPPSLLQRMILESPSIVARSVHA